MNTKFNLHLEVALDDGLAAQAIEIARHAYKGHGASALVDGKEQVIPPEQFISCAEQALMELVEANPLFEKVGIRVDEVSCRRSDVPLGRSDDPEMLPEEFDEDETGVYLCRWPNGEFSIVMADSKHEAIVALDEWDAADPLWLTPMETSMIDFRLNNRGEIELSQFGEQTAEFIWKTCYRVLDQVLTDNAGDQSQQAMERIKTAVDRERIRLLTNQPPAPIAKTEIGRELQRRLGAAGPVADEYVEQFATGVLKWCVKVNSKPS
jgi:hypothetical protein